MATQTGLYRRGALLMFTGPAVLPIMAAPPEPDARLADLAAEVFAKDRQSEEWATLADRAGPYTQASIKAWEMIDASADAWQALIEEISTTRSQSRGGLRSKSRVLLSILGERPFLECAVDKLAHSLASDILFGRP